MNSILRLIVWAWSIGWLGCGASALSSGDATILALGLLPGAGIRCGRDPQRSPKTRTAHRLPDPHLTHLVRLFHIAHHDAE